MIECLNDEMLSEAPVPFVRGNPTFAGWQGFNEEMI